jgi:hypothetical protein
LDELSSEVANATDDSVALTEAERITLEAARADLEPRRQRNLSLYERGRLTDDELDQRLDQIEEERREIERQLSELERPEQPETPLDSDLLEALRERLDAGLTDEQRSEIVRLLVKQITVHTKAWSPRDEVRMVIEYRLSSDWCSRDRTGTRASQNYTSLKRVLVV